MSSLKNIDGRTIIKFALSLGYCFVRSKGNHKVFSHRDRKTIVIPVYKKKIIKIGLLNGLLRDMNIEKKVILNYISR